MREVIKEVLEECNEKYLLSSHWVKNSHRNYFGNWLNSKNIYKEFRINIC